MLHGKGNFSFFIIHVVQREGKRKERGKTKYSSPYYGATAGLYDFCDYPGGQQ